MLLLAIALLILVTRALLFLGKPEASFDNKTPAGTIRVVCCLQHSGAAQQCDSVAGGHKWDGEEHPGRAPGSSPWHHQRAEHRQHPPHAAQLC